MWNHGTHLKPRSHCAFLRLPFICIWMQLTGNTSSCDKFHMLLQFLFILPLFIVLYIRISYAQNLVWQWLHPSYWGWNKELIIYSSDVLFLPVSGLYPVTFGSQIQLSKNQMNTLKPDSCDTPCRQLEWTQGCLNKAGSS